MARGLQTYRHSPAQPSLAWPVCPWEKPTLIFLQGGPDALTQQSETGN